MNRNGRTTSDPKNNVIKVILNDNLANDVSKLSDKKRITVSEIVRLALAEYVLKNK